MANRPTDPFASSETGTGLTGPIDPRVDIGHVHLKVADLDRALAFYQGVLGFQLIQRFGAQAAFISAGGYHHHIGLNTWESRGGSPPAPGTTGLYHVAIRYPDRAALALALRRLVQAGVPLDGAADHGVSEALYLRDPDQNGVELYWDRPRDAWPRDADGELTMYTRRLDVSALLAEAPAAAAAAEAAPHDAANGDRAESRERAGSGDRRDAGVPGESGAPRDPGDHQHRENHESREDRR